MSGFFEVMQVCKNGHQITANYNGAPQFRQDRCEKCGAETIYKCQKCGADIKGKYISANVIDLSSVDVPLYCHKCGRAYPWALRLKIAKKLKIPMWVKKSIKWLGKNLVQVALSIAIAVISAFIIWKIGIK